MGINVAVVNVAANTSLGTQDITVSGFGTVKGYLIWVSRTNTIASSEAHASMSFGMSDGTRHGVVAARAEDNVGTSNDTRTHNTNAVVRLINVSANSYDGVAIHNSIITDGIRIEWTDALAQASRVQVMLLGGDDLSLHVGQDDGSTAVDVANSITAPGFQAKAVIFLNFGNGFLALFDTDAQFPIGAGYDDGIGVTQGAAFAFSEDNEGMTKTSISAWNDRIAAKMLTAGGTFGYTELTGFETNGFEITQREQGSTELTYMALASSTNDIFAGIIDVPTGTGNQPITGIGFKPQAVAVAATGVGTINTIVVSGNNAGNIAFGMFNGTNEDCLSVKLEDQRNISDTVGRWDAKSLFMQNKANNIVLDATFVSFDSDGYTLNYASNSLAGAKQLVIAFEENAPLTALQDPILSQGVVPFAR